jgi:DHA2 family methylenomycin A resistance protein-like MFS transporter
MTSQSLADVEPDLHGAASSVFNTSRQVGAAVGIATFGPLLGEMRDAVHGFALCAIVGAAATLAALVLTYVGRPRSIPVTIPTAPADQPQPAIVTSSCSP